MNPYFDLSEPVVIKDVETLLSLNVRKDYGSPGEPLNLGDTIDPSIRWHRTAGLFRGQVRDWPLIPKGWRQLPLAPQTDASVEPIVRSVTALSSYRRFCERAQLQNPAFPSFEIERMCIAQHFGVPTALLDWTQNIFTAIFFSIRELLDRPEMQDDPRTFIYHIVDERYLDQRPPRGEDLVTHQKSSFVGPFYADRRIERQRGVFTFHPDPMVKPAKAPVQVYIVEIDLITRLQTLLDGFGFTHDYFFPDYAGIAHAISKGESPWI